MLKSKIIKTMEHHRLKPMTPGYDQALFNDIYKKTTHLRRKLAYGIDARKFGVDYDEILSWFDVKFIHSFNKFYRTFKVEDTKNFDGKLLGYIINALSTYKYRVMKSSYQSKYHTHASMEDVTTLYNYVDADTNQASEAMVREEYMEKVMDFMKKKLSSDALLVLDIQLNPPMYITSKLEEMGKKEDCKIPAELVADYLGMGISQESINYVNRIRKNIRKAITNAQEFFSSHPPQLQLS